MLRFWILGGGLALAAGAHASFELGLIVDAGTNKVHRYDMQTGAYFGSFGMGLSSPNSIAIDQQRGLAFVGQNAGGYHIYDYNTGELLNVVFVNNVDSDLGISPINGRLIVAGNSSLTEYTSTAPTAMGLGYGVPATPLSGLAIGPTQFMVTALGSNRALVYSYGFSSPTANYPLTIAGEGQGAWIDNVAYFTDGTTNVTGINVSNGGTVSLSMPTATSYTAIARAHGRSLYVAGRNGAASILVRYNLDPNGLNGFVPFATTQMTNPTAMAVVLAPEPASLVALGLGGLALLRRRRR